jgi:hypothetical protein
MTNPRNESTRRLRRAAINADLFDAKDWTDMVDTLLSSEILIARPRDRFDALVDFARCRANTKRNQLQRDDLENEASFQRQVRDLQSRSSRVHRRARENRSRPSDARCLRRAQKQLEKLFAGKAKITVIKDVQFELRTHVDVRAIWAEQKRRSARHARSPRIGAVTDTSGNQLTDDLSIESAFVNHFTQIGCPARPNADEIASASGRVLEVVPHMPETVGHISADLSPRDVSDALDACSRDPRNAAGPDGLNYEFFRRLRTVLKGKDPTATEHVDAVTRLLADIWQRRDTDNLPEAWLQSTVSIIHKGGDRQNPANHRPISLMSSAFKIITRGLLGKLKAVLNQIVNPEQHAFVPGREGIDAVATVIDVCKAARFESCQGDGKGLAFFQFDFRKAYDTIDRGFISAVLGRFGFSKCFTDAVRNHVLSDAAVNSIVLNGRMTRWYSTSHGIRQGDCLSTVLYVLAVSPIYELFRRCGVAGYSVPKRLSLGQALTITGAAFADDIGAFASSDNDVHAMRTALTLFETASGQVTSDSKSIATILVNEKNPLTGVEPLYEYMWPKLARLVQRCPNEEEEEWTILGFPLRSGTLLPDTRRLAGLAIASVTAICAAWGPSRSRLSMTERAMIFNTAARAKLCYWARLIPFSSQLCSAIDRVGADFIDPLTTGSVPLADSILFGDRSIGGLSIRGIGTTRSRTTALLARRAIAFYTEPTGSWRRLRAGFGWQLAALQIQSLTGTAPSAHVSMPSEHLFDTAGALRDDLATGAWALCAAHDLQLREWSGKPVAFDTALSVRAWRAPLLGGGPRPDTEFQRTCVRVLHLFSQAAWSGDGHPEGGPTDWPTAGASGQAQPAGVLQQITAQAPRCGLVQAVDLLRRRSSILDIAHRAIRGEWTDGDVGWVAELFSRHLVAHVDFDNRQFVVKQLGVFEGIGAQGDGSDGGLLQPTALIRRLAHTPSALDLPVGAFLRLSHGAGPLTDVLVGDQVDEAGHHRSIAIVTDPGDQARIPLVNVWRTDTDECGNVYLLADSANSWRGVTCPIMGQMEQMVLVRRAREEWAVLTGTNHIGASRASTMMMCFERTERAMMEGLPKSKSAAFGDLTTAVLAQRARAVAQIGSDKWVDRDSSADWSRFQPWTDMYSKALALSLHEIDFVRRLMTRRFRSFPRGWDLCPLCHSDAGRADHRHLVFTCPNTARLRDALTVRLTDAGLSIARWMLPAWVWRVRPDGKVGALTAVQLRWKILAIRASVKAQMAWRRAIWMRFDTPVGQSKAHCFTGVEENMLISQIADQVTAGLL